MTTTSSDVPRDTARAPGGALHRSSEWAYRVLGRWYCALASLVVFVTFLATVSTAQAERTDEYAADVDLPDTSAWYTPSDVYAAAEAIGQAGRDSYVEARYTFDVVWPLVYTVFFVVLLSWAFHRATDPGTRRRLVNLFPLVPLVLDYLENLTASIVMTRYPDETPVVAHLMPVFSLLKWATLSACFALVVVGAVATLLRRRGARPA
jgi:hypothetical protein